MIKMSLGATEDSYSTSRHRAQAYIKHHEICFALQFIIIIIIIIFFFFCDLNVNVSRMNFVKDNVKLKCQNLAMTDLKMWRRRRDVCRLYANNILFYLRPSLYKYVSLGFFIQLGLGTRNLGLLRATGTLRCSNCYLRIKR